ncbi:MAG TPA: hypothetical protein VLX28_11795 [Thermoanaerobaculia bacterium]|nr:hypothetical protein [Thermoanaerobaculia bacterium]
MIQARSSVTAKADSTPQPWNTPRSWVCIALTVATMVCYGISLGASNVIWVRVGLLGSVLLVCVDLVVGVALLIVEVKDQHGRAVLWPVLLLCTCGAPILLALLGGLLGL